MGIRANGLAAAIGAGAILLLVLTSCANTTDEGGPDPSLRGQWELSSATDALGAIPLANQRISLTIDGDNSTSGRSTCSDYSAHVYGTVTDVWITASLTGVSHCAAAIQSTIDRRYIDDLGRVRTAHLTGGVLDLLAPGIDLHYVRALAVPLDLVVDRTWRLSGSGAYTYNALTNPTIVSTDGATVRFGKDGTVTGITGCRSFTAEYAQNAGEIVLSHLVEHAGGRCDAAAAAADRQLLAVLRAGFTYTSELGALEVESPRAELALTFVS